VNAPEWFIHGMDAVRKQRPRKRRLTERVIMVINTNIAAQNGARLLAESSSMLSKSLGRLSSGSKILSPEDDAAGAAVALRFDAQINRTAAANSNVGNAISFSQTQDGFLKKVGKALDRMSELAILAQDITKTDADRALYNAEFTTLGAYIDDVATKNFNGVDLFDGTALDVTTDGDGTTFSMTGVDLGAGAYTTATGSTVDNLANASTALTNVTAAIDQLTSDRATIGANVARLTSTSEQLGVLKDNLAAANSRIKDVDVAQESTQYARFNILVQAGTAMLAQANSTPQSVLRLLQ
jgi:flagellin